MNEIADRFRNVAADLTRRALAVPDHAWDNPAPCAGWVARDVVEHMIDWMPAVVVEPAGLARPAVPPVADDPAAAWVAFAVAMQEWLDDPDVAGRQFDTRHGPMRFDDAVAMYCIGDIVMHTWDLARATGQDETLDPDEVHRLYEGMLPLDDVLRASGHYGPKVDVPDDADEQTKLIAFSGRTP
jgi:uncharacterized protein (TIGR03086 family)